MAVTRKTLDRYVCAGWLAITLLQLSSSFQPPSFLPRPRTSFYPAIFPTEIHQQRLLQIHTTSTIQSSTSENYSFYEIVTRKEKEIDDFVKKHSASDDPLQMLLGYMDHTDVDTDYEVKRTKLPKALRRGVRPGQSLSKQTKNPTGETETATSEVFEEDDSPKRLSVGVDIKRKSPTSSSPRPLVSFDDAGSVASAFVSFGVDFVFANCDYSTYGGDLSELKSVVAAVRGAAPSVPVIMKDIVIDPIQIALAKHVGCDAIVVMACIVGDKLEDFLNTATLMNFDIIVEVHTSEEISNALEAGATNLLVNRFDRMSGNSFHPNQPFALVEDLPPGGVTTTLVTGGINTVEEAAEFLDAGFDGVLLGKGFMGNVEADKLVRGIREVEHGSFAYAGLGF